MHLLSLYIENYKNIKKQTFDFSNNTGYISLIGLNGSGKSNLLEAVGLIFNGILNNKKIPFLYELRYEHMGKIYTRKPRVAMIDGDKVKDSEMSYPSSVIACYSGEDLRLWHLVFEDYYMHFFKRAIDNKTVYPLLFYINKYCWNIALVSLPCSEKEGVKSFLKKAFDIDDLEGIQVTFSFNNSDSFKSHKAYTWIKRIQNDCLNENGRASLKSILSYEVPIIPNQSKEKSLFYYLYLLSQPSRNSAKGNNVEKYITGINIEHKGVSFDDYSEGYKKLILIECITQILGDETSLLLLDEPDAHVHVAFKKEILNCLGVFDGQTILTTHSPIFVNQMEERNIFPMVEGSILPQEKRVLIQKVANNEINIIDSACIVSSKYLLITEGPDDIFHIKSAISAFSAIDENYRALENVSFIFMGGAQEVENYHNEILVSLYDTLNNVVFAFDYDEKGREGAKMVQKLIDNGNDKYHYVFYHKTYPVPNPDIDFYLEDFFDRSTYKDVHLPNFSGTPSFAELKKASTWAGSIKKRIQRHKQEHTLSPSDYYGFRNFLEQLIISFNL